MLAKKAIEVVPPPVSPGYYSSIFLVPKPNGQVRPVFNLSKINLFIVCPHFKMETARSIQEALLPGEYVISIDLKDAYFHIPIHPKFRRYLRFYFQGVVYQFRVLPFGINIAPSVFTRVIEAVSCPLRKSGIKLHTYIDDWLLRHMLASTLLSDRDITLNHLLKLGFLLNFGS